MKKIMFAAVVAFWSSVFTLWAVAGLAPSAVKADEEKQESLPTITLAEIAKHDSEDDCWMAIDGKVYDFTEYLPRHPAAPEEMNEWCGKEATEAYNTKGYGRAHSPRADAMMPKYLIGVLKQ